MFRFKRFFWTLLAVLVLAYAGAHALIRTAWLQSVVERGLSERFGYAVKAEKIRFSPCFGLVLTDVRLAEPGAAAGSDPVFSAPFARCFSRRGASFITAVNPVMRATQRADGSWSPAAALSAASCPPDDFFNRVSSLAGRVYFDFSDATVQVLRADGSSETYCGVNWGRTPVRGVNMTTRGKSLRYDTACAGFVRVQCLVGKDSSGGASTRVGENGDFAILREWIEIDGLTFFIKGGNGGAAPGSAPAAAEERRPKPETPPEHSGKNKDEVPPAPEPAAEAVAEVSPDPEENAGTPVPDQPAGAEPPAAGPAAEAAEPVENENPGN